MMLYYKLRKYFNNNNTVANDIINSISYKVGFGITYPLRFIIDLFSGKKTVLFHKNLPDNDFSKRFEEQWIKLINANNTSIYNSKNLLSFDLEGNVDEFNKQKIRGWYRNRYNKSQRLRIEVYQNNKNIGTAVCDKYRTDLVAEKVGDGHYGFFMKFNKPLKNNDNITLKISSNDLNNNEFLERAEFTLNGSTFQLSNSFDRYSGNFDKIIDTHACGWIINKFNKQDNVTVLLYRNDELINTGQANLYRNDLRTNSKAFRLKIPLVELLKGKATYKICTADKFGLGSIEWDPQSDNQLINQKLNSLKIDLCLPYYNGFNKPVFTSTYPTVAIHIHVFYVDVFEEICTYLKQFKFDYHLFISTPESNLRGIDNCLEANKIAVKKIVETPNRGRDVAPFVVEFGAELLNYDVALHLHTKKTKQNAKLGEIWLKHILDCLIKDAIYVNAIFKIFENLPKIGVISPKVLTELIPLYNWGKNYKTTKSFLNNLNIETPSLNKEKIEFPAGTMFWFKPKALEKLLTSNINYKSFPQEPISGDGSLAHAIERSIYFIAESEGYTYQTVYPINPNLIHSGNENIAISIIIPIYNAERWLMHAIQSILQQTHFLEPFEILLIDNNSTDSSTSIAKMFSAIYSNIHYHFESKKGAGNARNSGIKKAKGKYLFFLDADDILDSRALQSLMDLAYNDLSDLITSPLIIFNEKKFNNPVPAYFTTSKINIDMNALRTNTKIDKPFLPYLKAIFSDFGPCAKLYKKEFIIKNNIQFPEGLNYEDNYFVYLAYLSAANISVCDEPTYLYRKLAIEKGTTQSTSLKESDLVDQCEIMLMLIELLNKKENKVFKFVGYQSIVQKLVWMFKGIDKLQNTNAIFFPKLSKVLSLFSNTEIEKSGGKYADFFIFIKNKNFSKAVSEYNKN